MYCLGAKILFCNYERISGLQEPARLKGADAAFSKFTRMPEQDMVDIHDRSFNE